MADMRRRDGKLKIMHTIIGDFGKELRQIAEMDEIDSILTGTISPSKSYRETLTFQYFTDNGVKLLAKTTTAVQEIFLVTGAPELVLDELVKTGHVQLEREDVRHGDPRSKRGRRKRRRGQSDAASSAGVQQEARGIGAGGGAASDGRRPDGADAVGHFAGHGTGHAAQASAGRRNGKNAGPAAMLDESAPPTLGQHLGADTLSALQRLKERVTPKQTARESALAQGGDRVGGRDEAVSAKAARRPFSQRDERKQQEDDEENFAKLFSPAEDEESFEELLNKSKLDPKFFK